MPQGTSDPRRSQNAPDRESFENYCAVTWRRPAVLEILMYLFLHTADLALRRPPPGDRSLRFIASSIVYDGFGCKKFRNGDPYQILAGSFTAASGFCPFRAASRVPSRC